MNTAARTTDPMLAVTTSHGGECVGGFRILRSEAFIASQRTTAPKGKPGKRTLAEANRWLVAHAAKVDAHAKTSTKRLIGRSSV